MFVDDIKIIASKKSGIIKYVKAELTIVISIVDIKFISFYFGLKVKKNKEKRIIKLSQLAYIDKVSNKFHFDKVNTINTLIKETMLF